MYDDEQDEKPLRTFARVTPGMYVSIEDTLAIYAEPGAIRYDANGAKPTDYIVKFLFYGGHSVAVNKVFPSQEAAEAFIHGILEEEE